MIQLSRSLAWHLTPEMQITLTNLASATIQDYSVLWFTSNDFWQVVWQKILLSLAGDVDLNPGPLQVCTIPAYVKNSVSMHIASSNTNNTLIHKEHHSSTNTLQQTKQNLEKHTLAVNQHQPLPAVSLMCHLRREPSTKALQPSSSEYLLVDVIHACHYWMQQHQNKQLVQLKQLIHVTTQPYIIIRYKRQLNSIKLKMYQTYQIAPTELES